MVDLIQIGIATTGMGATLFVALIASMFISNRSFLPDRLSGKAHFKTWLVILILIALADFYFVSFIPVVARLA